ncbi:MAG: efflux RND transporter permease subunit [Alphaproteobacteria bacterium]|nr:efflux RND transporter permease subunit [Alphaproteobacteria bacterium]
MDIAAFSVRNWQFTLVVFLGLVLLGFNSFLTIPRAEDPSFPIPVFVIVSVLPGADPEDVEKLVSDPIEDQIDSLEDIREIRSQSSDGLSVVTVEFTWGVDVERKYDEVVREVNALRPSLPAGLLRLDVDKVRTSLTNIVQVALVSGATPFKEMEELADDLKDIIDRVPGVNETEIWGAPQSQVQAAIDLGKLATLNVPVSSVIEALESAGSEVPAGAVHSGGRRFNLKGAGGFDTVEEVGATLITGTGARSLRVRDVAQVGWALDEPTHLTWFNGERAVFITANMKEGENIFTVRNSIYAALDAFEARLPAGVRLERGFDQSRNVAERLGNLLRDFSIALGLVLITLLPLGLRASIVVMISIPLSLAIGVSMLHALGFSLNQLSIAGFVVALGLLVDDSIVVTENIARHLRMGQSRRDAAISGTREIMIAVLGCTATLMLAFVPLLALPEGSGQFIRSLPVTVLVTVGASLLVALTIIPFLASSILARHENPEGNFILRGVMAGIHWFYRPLLHVALLAPRMTLLLSAIAFAATLPLIPYLGFSLFPPAGTPQFIIEIETPHGTALSETAKALNYVEDVLAATPEVRWTMSNLGHGNPQIFYNVRPRQENTAYASVFVELKEWRRKESEALIDRLRQKFSAYPGALIVAKVFENGPPIEAPIAIRIAGEDIETLAVLARQAAAVMEETPGVRDVDNPLRLKRTDLDLNIDEEKAATLGVPPGAIDNTIRAALEGVEVGRFREADGDDFPVVVRLPIDQRHELEALKDIFVPTRGGEASAALSLFTAPQFDSGPARIDRYQRVRTVTITAYTQTGYNTGKVTTEILNRLKTIELPSGYALRAGGQAEAASQSFAGLGSAILIAIFGILAVLILEFRSLSATAVVAGVIPLGVMGGLIALWPAGYSLSFTATIGFIALIGIEIKNSILLVDFTTQLRRQGLALREAIERAGEIRFLPVLLTSITAIGGLTPLVLEDSGLFSPLATVIIGGLVSSTLLSRLVTPVMYLLLAPRELDDEEYSPEKSARWERAPEH